MSADSFRFTYKHILFMVGTCHLLGGDALTRIENGMHFGVRVVRFWIHDK